MIARAWKSIDSDGRLRGDERAEQTVTITQC